MGLELAHEHVESPVRIGGGGLRESVEIGCVLVLVEEKQYAVSQHSECGDGVGVAGLIFTKAGVFSPVVADFDPAPVAADVLEPLLRAVAVDRRRTDIVPREAVLGLFECGRFAPDADHRLDMGEVDIEGIDRTQGDVVVVDSAVGFLFAGKKGGSSAVSVAARVWTVF